MNNWTAVYQITFSACQAKAFDKKTSVLQYLVKIVKQNDESLLKIKDDLTFIERAQNLTIDDISREVSVITDELKRIGDIVNKYGGESVSLQGDEGTGEVGNGFTNPEQMQYSSIQTFTCSAAKHINAISLALDTLKSSYSSLLEYFLEDPKKKSSDFFGTLTKFLLSFEGAIQFVENQERAKVNIHLEHLEVMTSFLYAYDLLCS